MKTKFFIAIAALLLVTSIAAPSAKAQSYQSAIGLNVGAIMGVNYKEFISTKSALEFNFGYQLPGNGVMLTAVYQYHINLIDNLNLYVGGGLNLGVESLHHTARFSMGIDPNVGFEYKFNRAPVALAVDYQPQINFFTPSHWGVAALKIRFTL